MKEILEPDAREGKLPKWASDLIGSLRRTVRDQQRQIAELRWDNPDTDVFLERGLHEDRWALPRNAAISFVPPGSRYGIQVRVKQDDGVWWLHIYCGDGRLIVQPEVANVIRVRVE